MNFTTPVTLITGPLLRLTGPLPLLSRANTLRYTRFTRGVTDLHYYRVATNNRPVKACYTILEARYGQQHVDILSKIHHFLYQIDIMKINFMYLVIFVVHLVHVHIM